MERITFLIFSIIFISCNFKRPEAKNINIEKSTYTTDSSIKRNQIAEKGKDCLCPEPYKNSSIQKKIKYGDRFLKFCSWDFDTVTNKTFEFDIYDDKDNLLLSGIIPTQFEIISLSPSLRLIQSVESKDLNSSDWSYKPIFEYEFQHRDKSFIINIKNIYKCSTTLHQQDSLLKIVQSVIEIKKNVSILENNYTLLFLAAISGNNSCLNKVEYLNKNRDFDGSLGELQSEIKYLTEIYRNIKNN